MDINNKVAIVTGGAVGIGFEISKELLKNGAKGVIIADVNEENGLKAMQSLSKEYGSKIIFKKTDVTNPYEFEDVFKTALSAYCQIDILINNAGIMNDVNYELEININLNGTIRGILLGLKYMGKDKNGKGGVILNICSTAAFELYPYFPMYSATKGGVLNLTHAFGHEFHYNRTGVSVIALCPGKTETNLILKENLLDGCMDELFKLVEEQDIQMADAVGRAAVHVIKNESSGTVRIIDQNNLYSINVPDWHSLKKLVLENI